MELLEENRRALENKHKGSIEKLEKLQISDYIRLFQAKDGKNIIGIQKDERIWFLNSRLEPEYAAEIFSQRYHIRVFGTYFVFGMSDGRHIRKMLEKCDKTNRIVVYEPDINIFFMACCSFELADLIEDKRVVFCVPDLIGSRLESLAAQNVCYQNMNILEMCILPGYDFLYREAYTEYEDEVIAAIKQNVLARNTKFNIGRKNPQHTFYHMKNMIYHNNHEQLRRKLAEYDLSNIPAIIVSAGPSLDKNVHELKKAQGKSFIIVVDAALRTVIKAGIRPDMVCTIDFKAPDYFFEGINLDGLIWLCGSLSKPWILEQANNKVFYHGHYCVYWSKLIKKIGGYIMPRVISGGSISTEAYSIVSTLGFKKIILVGQDLAFTNGVSHTKGAIGAFGNNDDYIKSRCKVKVEGINGELLDTDMQMWEYKRWFEKVFRLQMKDIDVINATEGGANIEGAENRRLKDVIEQECKSELDIYEIAKAIPPAFTEMQQKEILAELKNMPKYVQELRENIESTIEKHEKILDALKKNSCTDLKEKLSDLMEANEKLGKQDMFELLTMYALKEEYELGANIYVQEELRIDELVEKSLKLYRGYEKALDMFEEDVEEYIMKDRP